MNKSILIIILFLFFSNLSNAQQKIALSPVQGDMVCGVQVPGLNRQSFALGVPETIGSSEGMILNFPEVNINWTTPDVNGIVNHTWKTAGKIEYSVKLTPSVDYVDMEMTIKNLSNTNWTNVFSFNCLNPVNAQKFLDWKLERTYMSKNGKPFRMDGTTRINTGSMKTVQFYIHENYSNVSPFINGLGAISPDKTDDSYIVTMADDNTSYMAATSPDALFLFDNLDRCCIHSGTDFGDIPIGGSKTVISRFYFANGTLDDFITRFKNEVKSQTTPRVAMCWGKPWELADTTKWNTVYKNLDIMKFYIGDFDGRTDKNTIKSFISILLKRNIKIAVEIGGLLDWYADKGNRTAEFSFQQDYTQLKKLIDMIQEIDPGKSIDMLDMDGPIRRMLYPNDKKENFHTFESAVIELFKVVSMWRDSVPGIELNLLTNFPNWAWGNTDSSSPQSPAYFELFGSKDGYGFYESELNAIKAESKRTGLKFDGLTIDNPYDYATGKAQSNQPDIIKGVDWMARIDALVKAAKGMGLKVNMIFNTNGGRTAQGYSEQSLALIDLYHELVGKPDGYWIQSWYQLPGTWLPESEQYTMTNLTLEALKKTGKNIFENVTNPSNPNANQETKCVLNYLYSLSKKQDDKIISGQMINMGVDYEAAYQNDIVGLYNKTNKWVGLIGSNYQRNPSGLPENTHETNQRVIEYFKKGGLVTMFCSFSNPWTNKGFNDTTGRYQIMDLIDPSKPVHDEWIKRLDRVAEGIQELQDSGIVVLYRFFPENNGSWFWWGVQSPTTPTQEDWKKLWIHAHNYFTNVRKLNNILWVFAPSAKESNNRNPNFKPDMYYYPGNDYVDVVGTSVYNDTLDIPFYEELKSTGKPIVLTEFGPGNTSRAGTNYDYLTLIKQIKTKYPDFVYWMSWNDFSSNGGKDTVYYSPLNQKNGKELFEDAWVINREEIDWQTGCNNITDKQVLLEPEDGRVYHGACLMTYESGTDPIGPYLAALNDSTIQPAVRGFFFSIPGERGPANSFLGLKNFFHSADSIGFIPELSLFLIGKEGSTDSIIAVTNKYDNIIDSIITLYSQYGKRMFLRIGGEFNGIGPGWNGGGYHPYLYVTMFRKIVDKYQLRGLRDSIAVNWCYEPDAGNDFDSVDTRGARWYPGDEYVDWFGLDVFDAAHFDQSLPDATGRNITKKGKSERFLAMARAEGKPVFMSETSAKGINISSDNQDGIDDWNNWFAKFWEFIDVHKEIKGFNYINADWPVSAYPGWGDARIQNNLYVTDQYKKEMKKSKYIHLPFTATDVIESENNNEYVLMFPNPVNDYLTISGFTGEVKICNLMGIDIWNGFINENGRIDLSILGDGTYICKLKINDKVIIKKFIVVR